MCADQLKASPINIGGQLLFCLHALALWWVVCVSYTIGTGIGVWGLNRTVGWAWDITNFVWWIGIGHAGTLNLSNLIIIPSKMAFIH